MSNLVNLTEVLTYLQAEQEFRLSPGQAWVRGGRLALPFLGAVRDRPEAGQIWPRGEYEATATIGVNQPEPPAFAVTVTVEPEEFSIDLAGPTTQQLTVRAFDEDGNELFGHAVTYVSSAPSKATVSTSGLVSPVATGDATISAVVDGAVDTASCHVFASPPAVATVTVSPDPFAVGVGQTVQLSAVTKASGGEVLLGRTVTWDTDNHAIATVDSNGLVTGVAEGSVVVTATSESIDGTADGEVLPEPDVTDPLYYFSCNETGGTRIKSSGRAGGTAPGSALELPGEMDAFHMAIFDGHAGKARKNTATDGTFQPIQDALARFPGNQSWAVAVWFNRGEGSWGGGENYLLAHNGFANPVCEPLVFAGGSLKARAGDISAPTDYESGITTASVASGWHHVAVVNDVAANMLKFYKNGSLVSTQAAINVVAVASGVYGLGSFIANVVGLNKPWGSFDELYIFDRAINAASVALLAA